MDGFSGEGSAINSFSLVVYVPQPLAGFIERLRQEIQPGCTARTHLTLLPPRLLEIPLDQIASQLEAGLRNQSTFRVELCDVLVFPVSQAVHLSLGAGWAEANHIHETLNRGDLYHRELFEYHPHVTLAQDLDPGNAAAVAELAKQRWQAYSGNRDFAVDHLTLVQNRVECGWTTLGEFALRVPVSV
jgi:2'-5' RNA ligase